jgi:hypothetical protein
MTTVYHEPGYTGRYASILNARHRLAQELRQAEAAGNAARREQIVYCLTESAPAPVREELRRLEALALAGDPRAIALRPRVMSLALQTVIRSMDLDAVLREVAS